MRKHSLIASKSGVEPNSIIPQQNLNNDCSSVETFSSPQLFTTNDETNDPESDLEDNGHSAEDSFSDFATSNDAQNLVGLVPPVPPNDQGGQIAPPPRCYTQGQINKSVLRVVRDKTRYGWSRVECLSQLQNLRELTGDDRIPSSSWNQVMSFLRNLGYEDPKTFKLCISDNHVTR